MQKIVPNIHHSAKSGKFLLKVSTPSTRYILQTPLLAVTISHYLIPFTIYHSEQTLCGTGGGLLDKAKIQRKKVCSEYGTKYSIFCVFYYNWLDVHSLKLKCTMTNKFHFFISTFKSCFAQNFKKIVWRSMSCRKFFLNHKAWKCIILRNFWKSSHNFKIL